jgi:hypothetical protein
MGITVHGSRKVVMIGLDSHGSTFLNLNRKSLHAL